MFMKYLNKNDKKVARQLLKTHQLLLASVWGCGVSLLIVILISQSDNLKTLTSIISILVLLFAFLIYKSNQRVNKLAEKWYEIGQNIVVPIDELEGLSMYEVEVSLHVTPNEEPVILLDDEEFEGSEIIESTFDKDYLLVFSANNKNEEFLIETLGFNILALSKETSDYFLENYNV